MRDKILSKRFYDQAEFYRVGKKTLIILDPMIELPRLIQRGFLRRKQEQVIFEIY